MSNLSLKLKYDTFIVALLLFSSFSSLGQVKKDAKILKYIEAQTNFVNLTDTSQYAESLRPYSAAIIDYFSIHKMDLGDYWIWTSYIEEDAHSIFIPICHYDGFVFKKNLEEQNIALNKERKSTDPITVVDFYGNASTKDGTLEIDKMTYKVLSYKYWQ